MNADWTKSDQEAKLDYCRRARRIRASFSREPWLRQHALVDLAKQDDRQRASRRNPPTPFRWTVTTATPPAPGSVPVAKTAQPHAPLAPVPDRVQKQFARRVIAAVAAPGFTYSDRNAILEAAGQMGIPRVRANRLLAVAQNQSQSLMPPAPISSGLRSLATILIGEILLVAAIIWLVH